LKKLLLALFIFSSLLKPVSGDIVGYFDGDSQTSLHDVVILLAWTQLSDKTSISKLLARSQTILNEIKTVTRLPVEPMDSLSGDTVTLKDVVLMLAWTQLSDKSDWSKIKLRANTILQDDYSSLEYLPQTPIGDSTVPVTITGIQVDNP